MRRSVPVTALLLAIVAASAIAGDLLSAAGVPLQPRTALTANALFAQLRPHGRVLREPP